MTWNERWEMHNSLRREHRNKSIEALKRFQDSRDRSDWEEYLSEDHLANKHFGIAQAMWTRKYGKVEY